MILPFVVFLRRAGTRLESVGLWSGMPRPLQVDVAQGHAHFAGTCGLLPMYGIAAWKLSGILIQSEQESEPPVIVPLSPSTAWHRPRCGTASAESHRPGLRC